MNGNVIPVDGVRLILTEICISACNEKYMIKEKRLIWRKWFFSSYNRINTRYAINKKINKINTQPIMPNSSAITAYI